MYYEKKLLNKTNIYKVNIYMNIIKRDGVVQEFNKKKPINALTKVFVKSLKQEVPEKLLEQFNEVLDKFVQKNEMGMMGIELNDEKEELIEDVLGLISLENQQS